MYMFTTVDRDYSAVNPCGFVFAQQVHDVRHVFRMGQPVERISFDAVFDQGGAFGDFLQRLRIGNPSLYAV